MKKIIIYLSIIALTLIGFITYKNYNKTINVSNLNYYAAPNIVGKKVTVNGISGSFHVLSNNNETIRLLYDDVTLQGYTYNKSSDGDTGVDFEDSMLYQGIVESTKSWKSSIESSGGKTNIFKVDAPTINEVLNAGGLSVSLDDGKTEIMITKTPPTWLTNYTPLGTASETKNVYEFLTKSLNSTKKVVYTFKTSIDDNNKVSASVVPESVNSSIFGGNVRPVLETSIHNLKSDEFNVQSYINSLNSNTSNNNNNSNNNTNTSNNNNSNEVDNSSEAVNVPPTSASVWPIIAIEFIVISSIIVGVTYFILRKNEKARIK